MHPDNSIYNDPFAALGSIAQSLPAPGAPYNPYSGDHAALAGSGASYFQQANAFSGPIQPVRRSALYMSLVSRQDSLIS